MAQRSRFQASLDNVSAVIVCGDMLVELTASQSLRSPFNNLTLDFERASVNVPHAMAERSFPQLEIASSSGSQFKTFPVSDLYGNEVADFISMLTGRGGCGTTLEEACHAVQLLGAITESYTTGRTVSLEPAGRDSG